MKVGSTIPSLPTKNAIQFVHKEETFYISVHHQVLLYAPAETSQKHMDYQHF